mmetsp:Transcript_11212/g.12615  ORF Transcript_11212/g.12615 Transcript_11212/m.12615 type:complete len:86 (-) Transcript_11212:497-754(-)
MLVNNDVNLLVGFVVISVSIHSPLDNYYTIIPSIYVQLGDAVDVLYDGVMLVVMTWYTDDMIVYRLFVTTVRDDDVAFSIVCRVQ